MNILKILPITVSGLILLLFIPAEASGEPSLVKDIYPGTTSSFPSNLTAVGGKLFFTVGDDLWVSDGTSGGTFLVKPGTDPHTQVHAVPTSLVNANGTLLFLVDVDSDLSDINNILFNVAQLWRSDGTVAGTKMVANVTDGGHGNLTDGEPMIFVNGRTYFNGVDSQNGRELWSSDGTATGTQILKDINPGAVYNTPPGNLTNVNGTLFFTADDGSHGEAIWKTDGTTTGTTLVFYGATFINLTNVDGVLYFTFENGFANSEGAQMWKSSGDGARRVFTFPPFSSPQDLVPVNGTLFFSTFEQQTGIELWKTDGTSNGTVIVKDINPNGDSNAGSLTRVGGTLFFAASDGSTFYELWKSDGTAAGTVLVKDINGNGGSIPSHLTDVDGKLLFSADDGIHGKELWESDGTTSGTVMLADINPKVSDSNPSFLTNVAGTLFFAANDGNTGVELWKNVVSAPPVTPTTLGNISTRLSVGTGDNVLIGGFIINGTQPKKVLIRATGPSLAKQNIAGALANPMLTLVDGSGKTVATNDDWQTDPNAAQIPANLLPGDPKESAVLTTLAPGNYTAIVSGVGGGTGIALVEAYDLDQTVDSKLANISTRGFVQTADNVMIGGLIIQGSRSAKVIIRGRGPSLPGVANPLLDPTLDIFNASGVAVASNDNWQTDPAAAEMTADNLAPTDPREAATLQTLAPGNYTAIVRGANGTTGVGLVEVYNVQ